MSLDAQTAMLKEFAVKRDYELTDVVVDTVSGKNLNREGIQRIIKGLSAGEVSTLIVCKFDRLSRSLIDFFTLVEKYFSKPERQLISISEDFDTRSPAGQLIIPLIVLFAQWERRQIAERTRTAIEHIQSLGGHFGATSFGHDKVQAKDGLCKLVENRTEQHWLEMIYKWQEEGKGLTEMADLLNVSKVLAKRGGKWSKHTVYNLLRRRGKIVARTDAPHSELKYDKFKAWDIAYKLRQDDRTYAFIAAELTRQGLRPLKAAKYGVTSVVDLLQNATFFDRTTAYGYAASLKQQGVSLREIGKKLTAGGFKPRRGGQWYAATVANLLRDGEQTI
jgi:DNA invertase Pin-like site-specific DNA recombinase